jgi:hypothetical protein
MTINTKTLARFKDLVAIADGDKEHDACIELYREWRKLWDSAHDDWNEHSATLSAVHKIASSTVIAVVKHWRDNDHTKFEMALEATSH